MPRSIARCSRARLPSVPASGSQRAPNPIRDTSVSPSRTLPAAAAGRSAASSVSVTVIGDMFPGDWPAVRSIYEQGLASGDATFDTEAPDWEAWNAGHLPAPRLVARPGDEVVGRAALSPVHQKSAYRGVAEGSAYVAESARGTGVARALIERMIER